MPNIKKDLQLVT